MSRTVLPPSGLPELTVVGRRRIHDGFVRFDICDVETTVRGKPARLTREVHDHGSGAAVLAYDPVGRVALFVRQRRIGPIAAGTDGLLLEAVAGIVDPGEDPAETARRESLEEAGIAVRDIRAVGKPFSTPGTVTERVHLFLAEYDASAPRDGGGGIEGEHEEIEVVELDFGDLAALADDGGIEDMKTLLLVETLRRRHPELFA